MKRSFFIGAAAMLALSCSSDDDGGNLSNVAVEGTWKITKYELSRSFDLNNDGVASDNLLTETSCFSNSSLLFKTGNAVTFNFPFVDFELVQPEGSESYEYITDCNTSDPEDYDYSVSDNVVTIAGELPLIRTGKKLAFTYPTNIPAEENGEITSENISAYIEFTKQ